MTDARVFEETRGRVQSTKATILLSFGLSVPAFAADSLKLAITGPFSGGSAPMGVSMRDGAKLAINEINSKGGIPVGNAKLKIEVKMEVRFRPNDEGKLVAETTNDVKIKSPKS